MPPTNAQEARLNEELVRNWWDELADSPDFLQAVRQMDIDERTMLLDQHPAYFETEQERLNPPILVRHAWNMSRRLRDTVLPEEHEVRFTTKRKARRFDIEAPAEDPSSAKGLADTIEVLVQEMCDEADLRSHLQSFGMHAFTYRMAILKFEFRRALDERTLSRVYEMGMAPSLSELESLTIRAARGDITPNSREWARMIELRESLGQIDEIKLWEGLNFQVVPLNHFRFDSGIREFHDLYHARWMSHEVFLERREVLARYPGISDDLSMATAWYSEVANENREKERSRRHLPGYYATAMRRWDDARNRTATDYDVYRVVEVWDRIGQQVLHLVEGLPYPAFRGPAVNRPRQFFPFLVWSANPVPGQPYGVSTMELLGPLQDEINRNATQRDEVRCRSKTFAVVDKSVSDMEFEQISNARAYEVLKGDFGGKNPSDILTWHTPPKIDEALFDVRRAMSDLEAMSNIHSAAVGRLDRANLATEIRAAQMGMEVASDAHQLSLRSTLATRLYGPIAEQLILELATNEVIQIVGPQATWPNILEQDEADRRLQEIDALLFFEMEGLGISSDLTAALASGNTSAVEVRLGLPPETVAQLRDALLARRETLIEAIFGIPEPVTRQSLFSDLIVKVTVEPTGEGRRLARFEKLLAVMNQVGPSLENPMVDPRRFILESGRILGIQDAVQAVLLPPKVVAAEVMLRQGAVPGTGSSPKLSPDAGTPTPSITAEPPVEGRDPTRETEPEDSSV